MAKSALKSMPSLLHHVSAGVRTASTSLATERLTQCSLPTRLKSKARSRNMHARPRAAMKCVAASAQPAEANSSQTLRGAKDSRSFASERSITRHWFAQQPTSGVPARQAGLAWMQGLSALKRHHLRRLPKVRPNPSLERTSTGLAHWPRGRAVYHRPRGQHANPAGSAQLKR